MTLPLPTQPLPLPPRTPFSQSRLSDFQTCARRFALRHLLRLRWPAPVAEPQTRLQQALADGQRFHRLAQLAMQGVPTALLRPSDDPLAQWWADFEGYATALDLPPHRLVERVLAADITVPGPDGADAAYPLSAKFDLVAHDDRLGGRIVIVDWKTGATRPPDATLADDLQTRVYRWLMVQSGTTFFGDDAISPAQITMVYWWAQHPTQPTVLPYSQAAYAEDDAFLHRLVAQVAVERDWPLTHDVRACAACPYRSYCDRGREAISADTFVADVGVDGPGLWRDDDQALVANTLDFDQLGEVAF